MGMPKTVSCIYSIKSPSGKAYIGSSSHFVKRKASHLWDLKNGVHHCAALQSAFRKYGLDGLEFSIIELCQPASLIEREQWWIDNHRDVFSGLYNSSGIAGRMEMNQDVRNKLSEIFKGRVFSDQTRAKMSESSTGKVASKEAREAMSRAQKGRKHTP